MLLTLELQGRHRRTSLDLLRVCILTESRLQRNRLIVTASGFQTIDSAARKVTSTSTISNVVDKVDSSSPKSAKVSLNSTRF